MHFLVTVAWRNLWRHRRRSLITATATAVAVALCMAALCFQDGTFALMFDVMVEQQLGHVQIHHPDYPGRRVLQDTVHGADALVSALEARPGVAAVAPRAQGFALVGTEARSTGVLLVGVDPVREERVTPFGSEKIRSGRWLDPAPSGGIVLGEKLAEELKVSLGDEVVAVTQASDGSLGSALFHVVGTSRTGSSQMDRSGGFVHLADAQDLFVLPDEVHAVTVITTNPDGVGAWVEGARRDLGSDAVQILPWWDASPQAAQLVGMQDFSAAIVLVIVFGAAGFGVMNTMMMSVFERTRELGVLKALGMRPGRLVALVLVESVLLTGLSAAIGLVLGGLLDAWLVWHGLDFSAQLEDGMSFAGIVLDPVVKGVVRWGSVVRIVLALFFVAVGASIWPALRAARLEPVVSLRAE